MNATRQELLDYVNKQVKTVSHAKRFLSRSSVDLKEYYDMTWIEDCFDYISFVRQFVEEVASDSWIEITMDAINWFYHNKSRYA